MSKRQAFPSRGTGNRTLHRRSAVYLIGIVLLFCSLKPPTTHIYSATGTITAKNADKRNVGPPALPVLSQNDNTTTLDFSTNESNLGGSVLNASTLMAMDGAGEYFAGLGQDRSVDYLYQNWTTTAKFFVDLAARHALETSNTRALERHHQGHHHHHHHWSGICIEPNPRFHPSLTRLRNCTVVGAVVADATRLIDFTIQEGHSGGSHIASEKQNDEDTTSTTKRWAYPLEKILDVLEAPSVIDYLSLDVEGAEELVLLNFPWHRYSIRMLTIEGSAYSKPADGDDSTASPLRKVLVDQGYQWACRTGGRGPHVDNLWIHSSFVATIPVAVLQGLPELCLQNCRHAVQTYKRYGVTSIREDHFCGPL